MPRMKMLPEHYKSLKHAFQIAFEQHPSIRIAVQQQMLSPQRLRWDIFNSFAMNDKWPYRATVTLSELYAYLNDDHIDTALRRIMTSYGVTCAIKYGLSSARMNSDSEA